MERPTNHEGASRRSGAPEAGGATSSGSRFGGVSLVAHLLRFVARVARGPLRKQSQSYYVRERGRAWRSRTCVLEDAHAGFHHGCE